MKCTLVSVDGELAEHASPICAACIDCSCKSHRFGRVRRSGICRKGAMSQQQELVAATNAIPAINPETLQYAETQNALLSS